MNASSKRLLLLLDDPFLSRFYRQKLEGAGFAVDVAHDLQHGLAVLEGAHPGLVVLDPLLAESDAVESIKMIRASAAGQGLTVLVLPTPHYTLSERLAGQANVQ